MLPKMCVIAFDVINYLRRTWLASCMISAMSPAPSLLKSFIFLQHLKLRTPLLHMLTELGEINSESLLFLLSGKGQDSSGNPPKELTKDPVEI
jgi:hypothetical protein